MHEHQVHISVFITREKLLQTKIEGSGGSTCVQAARNFTGDEVGVASTATFLQSFPHAKLVVVAKRTINVSVPQRHCELHSCLSRGLVPGS